MPVSSFVVKPSRSRRATAKLTASLSPSGPDTPARTSRAPKFPNGDRRAAGPAGQRRPAARHADEATKRVAAEQRALRSTHELHLGHVQEIDARRIGVELRDAVDVGRDPWVGRAGSDPLKRAKLSARAVKSVKYVFGA